MEFLLEYGLFLAKAVTIVIAIIVVVVVIVGVGTRSRKVEKGQIEVRNINDRLKQVNDTLRRSILAPEQQKLEAKQRRKEQKDERKALKKQLKKEGAPAEEEKRLYVLDFQGDVQASAVNQLREEITAVLSVATNRDEVLLRLESSGGLVHSYGLAASQLVRIRSKDVSLTVAIDKVAASGGYMMACIANKIVAAPFAVVGSIGVMAQIPNLHRLLKKNDVDVELLTAGEYKRTLTVFGENTDKGRAKFMEELEDTHKLFKDFVAENRPDLDMDVVSTGESWYGRRALERNLIDELSTSDEYISSRYPDYNIFHVTFTENKSKVEKLMDRFTAAVERWQRGSIY